MEMMVDDLQLGDEFLYSVQGTIARAKIIRPVEKKKVQPTHNPLNRIYYKAVKVKVAMKETSYTTNWNGNARVWTKKEYCASDNYTIEKFVDLNHRNVWLIKRQD
jgi:hypothetical protein